MNNPTLSELVAWLDAKGAASTVCQWGDSPGITFRALIEEFEREKSRPIFRAPDSCPVSVTCEREGGCSGMCPVRDRPTPARSACIAECEAYLHGSRQGSVCGLRKIGGRTDNADQTASSLARHARGCFNDLPGAVMCQCCGGDLIVSPQEPTP